MSHQPRKRFGQNFLQDPGIINQIVVAVAPRPGDRLVEIGPGQGAITKELLKAAGSLQAIELDRDLIGPLASLCAPFGDLSIHSADALRFDFSTLAGDGKLRVVGNLPYNISTPLLFHLLEQKAVIADMHFMLQREVVERMAADPGGKDYGRLSVMLQAWCRVTHLFDIGPGAFNPPPKVHSAFVRLTPYLEQPHPIQDRGRFAQVVTTAFGQRRKTLRNALKLILRAEQIAACGIDPGARAETLSVADFVRLANLAP
ncbi:MAG: 16S rRNA (adenine(1518)-N(6)/adenine(1519)-N(6))-dimethyltransferase RsmA [Gammaproteobacteria bacterium]|nr:16S rRNA (adenine(1518)-N(6)/adenine(1519)-N(6))-dimethyltransferase RsmA [Gammaproteobacteria bacterium]MBU1655263.1 16S rRNA (adenine(1518)-N(6)/adenine(1519)-N(6))-dimethyltransferase RsmA [Gammaproteobacteria bacterium]MBU1962042.1 16S rRNA (adenine(1518)-N(6)/adenine(1519)-N(6))-dimethyltransferase RsmA [Gammaproteobacteria bacterium]